jgi:hypothetical protein
MISDKDIDTLRAIARAGDDYRTIRRVVDATKWETDEDDTELGFLRIFIPDVIDKYYRLMLETGQCGR